MRPTWRLALLLALLLGLAKQAAAAQCPTSFDLDAITGAIRRATSCKAAAAIGEQCAFGASGDVAVQSAVIRICEKDFAALLTAQARQGYDGKLQRCRHKYANMRGTMYVSAAAMCEGAVAQAYSARALKRRGRVGLDAGASTSPDTT